MDKNIQEKIEKAIKESLPSQVGEVLKSELERIPKLEKQLEEALRLIAQKDGDIKKLNATVYEQDQQIKKHQDLDARAKKVAEEERNLQIEKLQYQLEAEKQKIAKLKEERTALISPYVDVVPPGIEIVDESTFKLMLSGAKSAHEQAIKDREEAEAKRKQEEEEERRRQEEERVLNSRRLAIAQYRDFFDEQVDLKTMSEKEFLDYKDLLTGRKVDYDKKQEEIRKKRGQGQG